MFQRIDKKIIQILRKISYPLARFSLFSVFFWFGILKVIGLSPASDLVKSLLSETLPFFSFEKFIIFFGLYEMAIGVAFVIPGLERLAVALLLPHILSTSLPLILLSNDTWNGFLSPTLEGQYIIKNLVIIALAFSMGAHLNPLEERRIHKA